MVILTVFISSLTLFMLYYFRLNMTTPLTICRYYCIYFLYVAFQRPIRVYTKIFLGMLNFDSICHCLDGGGYFVYGVYGPLVIDYQAG